MDGQGSNRPRSATNKAISCCTPYIAKHCYFGTPPASRRHAMTLLPLALPGAHLPISSNSLSGAMAELNLQGMQLSAIATSNCLASCRRRSRRWRHHARLPSLYGCQFSRFMCPATQTEPNVGGISLLQRPQRHQVRRKAVKHSTVLGTARYPKSMLLLR